MYEKLFICIARTRQMQCMYLWSSQGSMDVCMVFTYICMYDHIIKQIGDKRVGMVANPARGQLNRQNIFTLSLFASETFV